MERRVERRRRRVLRIRRVSVLAMPPVLEANVDRRGDLEGRARGWVDHPLLLPRVIELALGPQVHEEREAPDALLQVDLGLDLELVHQLEHLAIERDVDRQHVGVGDPVAQALADAVELRGHDAVGGDRAVRALEVEARLQPIGEAVLDLGRHDRLEGRGLSAGNAVVGDGREVDVLLDLQRTLAQGRVRVAEGQLVGRRLRNHCREEHRNEHQSANQSRPLRVQRRGWCSSRLTMIMRIKVKTDVRPWVGSGQANVGRPASAGRSVDPLSLVPGV